MPPRMRGSTPPAANTRQCWNSDDQFLPEAITTFLHFLKIVVPHNGTGFFRNCIDPATGEWTGSGLEEDTDVSYQDVLRRNDLWGILWHVAHNSSG